MARTIEKFPSRGRTSRYPQMQEWLDGQIWELVAGDDFDAAPTAVRTAIAAAARRNGKKVRTRLLRDGDKVTLVVQATVAEARPDSDTSKPVSKSK